MGEFQLITSFNVLTAENDALTAHKYTMIEIDVITRSSNVYYTC